MRSIGQVREVRAESARARRDGRRIGLVPTMGALHEGHLSLVRRCRRECAFTVTSLFVNPSQFGPGEDFRAYPRDLERDAALLEREGVDLLFAPAAEEIYPPGHATWIEVGGPAEGLCGEHRPGHFRGVATIVAKLLNIVQPDAAYFGQKDWQQSVVVRRIVSDLDFPVEILVSPTVREPDGLALSSRNAYLSAAERERAPRLHRALQAAAERARSAGSSMEEVRRAFEESLRGSGFRPEYVEIRQAEDLAQLGELRGRIVIAAAARLGRTRLIDNIIIDIPHRTQDEE